MKSSQHLAATIVALAALFATDGPVSAADTQAVSPSPASVSAGVAQTIQFDVDYTTSNSDPTLTGLGLRIHFNSSLLIFQSVSEVLATALIARQDPAADASDFDGDPATDSFVLVAWADTAGNWPGQLPTRLLRIAFQTAPDFAGQTNVRFSASSTAAGYGFASLPAVVNAGAAPSPTFTTTPTTPRPSATRTPTSTQTTRPTSTTTVGPSATVTQTVEPSGCAGDCDAGGTVTVDELIKGVNIALGTAAIELCASFDVSGDGQVTVDELVQAVNNALGGCELPVPTVVPTSTVSQAPAPSSTPTRTRTVVPTITTQPATPTRTGTVAPTVTSQPATPTREPTASAGRCCDAHGGLGCEEALCESCVCSLDPYCCTDVWDEFCADMALFDCVEDCECNGDPEPTPPFF